MKKEELNIEIRECTTLDEFKECAELQKEVFVLPDIEISPVRHLVVTKSAGGFILGAFVENKLIGFVLSVPGFAGEKKFFYSHMTAVDKEFQNNGVGAKLKWAQRDYSLEKGIDLVKWTFQPVLARNAYFNLNRLGATIGKYISNFYGTDYPNLRGEAEPLGLDSDRLYADWELESEKVVALSKGEDYEETSEIARKIEIPNEWRSLVKSDLKTAISEQTRIKQEFEAAFSEGLIVRAFERSEAHPKYLLFAK